MFLIEFRCNETNAMLGLISTKRLIWFVGNSSIVGFFLGIGCSILMCHVKLSSDGHGGFKIDFNETTSLRKKPKTVSRFRFGINENRWLSKSASIEVLSKVSKISDSTWFKMDWIGLDCKELYRHPHYNREIGSTKSVNFDNLYHHLKNSFATCAWIRLSEICSIV